MKVVASTGKEDIAMVYVLDLGDNRLVECVEAVQPPVPIEKKWVLMVSMMCGCPVGCNMCDAGGYFRGKLSKEDIFAQIDFLVHSKFPNGRIPSEQFKVQLARMGEPSLNAAVLEMLDELPGRYHAPGLMPSFSTVAPHGTDDFFERLREIKQKHYHGGRFQFQVSIHTTDEALRDEIIPVRKWSFAHIADYGGRFYEQGDRKITLNFALAKSNPVEPQVLLRYFHPDKFLIKITPLNPTYQANDHGLQTWE